MFTFTSQDKFFINENNEIKCCNHFNIYENNLCLITRTKLAHILKYISSNNDYIVCYDELLKTTYILWSPFQNFYVLFDPKTQYISGKKFSSDYYEQLGCFIDHERKIMNYRICKNGSTNICEAFLGRIFGNKHENFLSIEKFKQTNINQNEYKKFIVLRDPLDRFVSCISMLYKTTNPICDKYPLWFNIFGIPSYLDLQHVILFCLKRIEFIIKYQDFEDNPHLYPQFLILNKLKNNGMIIDEFIDIHNLPQYLKTNFNYTKNIKCAANLNHDIDGNKKISNEYLKENFSKYLRLFKYDLELYSNHLK